MGVEINEIVFDDKLQELLSIVYPNWIINVMNKI